jgi:hypothetical protein
MNSIIKKFPENKVSALNTIELLQAEIVTKFPALFPSLVWKIDNKLNKKSQEKWETFKDSILELAQENKHLIRIWIEYNGHYIWINGDYRVIVKETKHANFDPSYSCEYLKFSLYFDHKDGFSHYKQKPILQLDDVINAEIEYQQLDKQLDEIKSKLSNLRSKYHLDNHGKFI